MRKQGRWIGWERRASSILLILVLSASCGRTSEEAIARKVEMLENTDLTTFNCFQIHAIRETRHPSYKVSRIPYDRGYAVIRTHPELTIERNFPFGDTIGLSFVAAFEKLDCNSLYLTMEFKRINFYHEKNWVILFNGTPPADQEFLAKAKGIKHFKDGWKFLIVNEQE